jgi:hypothetical protein
MSMINSPVQRAEEQPVLRRSRSLRSADEVDLERLPEDCLRRFDLEKFASDWRLGVGRHQAV